MSDDPRILLLGALVALLGVAWAAGVFDEQISTVEVPSLDVPDDPPERIRIRSTSDSLVLARSGSGWRLQVPAEAPGDSAAVSSLLESLRQLELSRVVTREAASHGEYGVGEGATRLTLEWPDRARALRIGDAGGGPGTRYVRVGTDDRVVLAEGRLQVTASLGDWRDKTLLSVAPSRIERVEVRRPDGSYEVRRMASGTQGAWQIAPETGDASMADSARAASWIRRFGALEADGVLPDRSPSSVREEASHELTVHVTGGAPVTLYFEEGEDRIAALGTQDAVFELGQTRLDRLVPTTKSLETGGARPARQLRRGAPGGSGGGGLPVPGGG